MIKTTLSKLKKGDCWLETFGSEIYEISFFVKNQSKYDTKDTIAYCICKKGFEVDFKRITRDDKREIFLIEKEDYEKLGEADLRIRETAKYTELYKNAEERSNGESLVQAYPNNKYYEGFCFNRGDIVRDCYDRIGIVLGIDGHSVNIIKRVDYRVEVEDCGKKGVGIFRSDEIKKIGKLEESELKNLIS
jgi:hypothetical protein